MSVEFYKENDNDVIWCVDDPDGFGKVQFSFDKKTVYNAWTDYPWKLTEEQIRAFDKQFPFWADFFSDRR